MRTFHYRLPKTETARRCRAPAAASAISGGLCAAQKSLGRSRARGIGQTFCIRVYVVPGAWIYLGGL